MRNLAYKLFVTISDKRLKLVVEEAGKQSSGDLANKESVDCVEARSGLSSRGFGIGSEVPCVGIISR